MPQPLTAPATAPPTPASPPPALQPTSPRSLEPAAGVPPSSQRPDPSLLPQSTVQNFDQSLDQLVRDGIVSPAERTRTRSARPLQPGDPIARKVCSEGAGSGRECRSVDVRWPGDRRGAPDLDGADLAGGLAGGGFPYGRLGAEGAPLPPLTVPVSALLAGAGGNFRLMDVFRVTPRPAPRLGNGNRSLLFPLIGSAVTTSNFGWRLHPVLGNWLMHAGRDLAAPEGTPVVAALTGRVVSSGLAGGYGLAVELEHDGPKRRTLYGHLSELFVKEGEWVKQGTVIGRVGSTGLSTGPHLHFELRLPENGGWVAIDPGELDPGREAIAGTDAIALLMGQLLQSLERPAALPPAPKPQAAG
ncbi:M23 family metallopeptidase [Synechococcus sp. CS-1324]|nr:M23 family metallopeptidase [Synechococcus sp. CS-1324]